MLAENENGNPVLTVNEFGKGKIYFLNFPLEINAMKTPDALNPLKAQPIWEIYKIFAQDAINSYAVKCDNPNVGVTECKGSDGKDYVFMVNYSNEQQNLSLCASELSKYQVVYGNTESISKCDALVLKSK